MPTIIRDGKIDREQLNADGYYARVPFTRAQMHAENARIDRQHLAAALPDPPRVDSELTGDLRAVTVQAVIPPTARYYATDADGAMYAHEFTASYSDEGECWVNRGGKWFICQTASREDWRESLMELGR